MVGTAKKKINRIVWWDIQAKLIGYDVTGEAEFVGICGPEEPNERVVVGR